MKRAWLRSSALWIVVLGFAVRIGFMVAAHTYLFARYRVDEYSYVNETTNIARSLAEGRGFSDPVDAVRRGRGDVFPAPRLPGMNITL